jgi:PadR family transcriptional regulator PadR
VTEPKAGLLQGTLDLLILRAVSLGPDHGLGIARRVQQITRGAFDVKPGSLFPALHRLEEQGWLRSEWGESENRRRAKYYELTKAGRRQIETETAAWSRIAAAMAAAIAETS